jgi:hypothetical protein
MCVKVTGLKAGVNGIMHLTILGRAIFLPLIRLRWRRSFGG